MIAVLTFNHLLATYVLSIIALLSLLLAALILHQRAHNWKLSRLKLRTCEECGLVFAVGRFNKSRVLECPRCHHQNHIHSQNK